MVNGGDSDDADIKHGRLNLNGIGAAALDGREVAP
jgi:hypothetical protein